MLDAVLPRRIDCIELLGLLFSEAEVSVRALAGLFHHLNDGTELLGPQVGGSFVEA